MTLSEDTFRWEQFEHPDGKIDAHLWRTVPGEKEQYLGLASNLGRDANSDPE